MLGGGVWADTATGLQGIENWLDAHPALLSLIKNTGNLAAGATWLKKKTPAGIVIGLVTNYGYEQVLKLMEVRIDVAKEALTSYFKAHDKDITEEQASYLANFSMEVLETVGQVAVHQVAAKRFNAVKKVAGKVVGKWKVTKASKKAGDSGKGVAKVQSPKGMITSTVKQFKAPKEWIHRSANNKKGTKYVNPNRPEDYIRFSEANLNPNAPSGQRTPYLQRHKNGKVLTKTGEWIRKDLADPESYHIPQSMFGELQHLMDL